MGLLGLQVQGKRMESQVDDPKQLHKALDFGEKIIINNDDNTDIDIVWIQRRGLH